MTTRKKRLLLLAGSVILTCAALQIPIGGGSVAASPEHATRARSNMDLSAFSDAAPAAPLRLLFIHHSCGGQLLADPGPDKSQARCIYVSHPNGGGLRSALGSAGYEVHEASYGSELGENTDLFDWLPKFRGKMDKVLTCDLNDTFYQAGHRNRIVVFKSCFPNNRFVAEGSSPGNPAGPELTVTNAKASLSALLEHFKAHPDVLFVYVTSPPNTGHAPADRLWKFLARKLLGKPVPAETLARQSALARRFNDWAESQDGWLQGYAGKNVVVFPYYQALTDEGASNLSRYPSEGGTDSHPSRSGNEKAARAFVPFLNRAVRRANL